MDLWTDPNLVPYMAVTAHWIQTTVRATESGPHYSLKMRTDLIGFQRVPGSHTGQNLAHSFYFIMKHLGILHKVCYDFELLFYSIIL